MKERIELLKAMDCIICNLDSDWAYKEWWNCMYENEEPKHFKKWEEFAADNDKFLNLTTKFLIIMTKQKLIRFILNNR